MKIKGVYHPYMLRPLLYMTAQRLMLAGIFTLAIHRFVKNGPAPNLIAGFLTILFALFTYLVYLRMDGIHLPRMKPLKTKKDPLRRFGDMTDHVDDEPQVTFDDLEDSEKDLCSLLANLINFAVWLALSFIL